MKVSGTCTLGAGAAEVFDAICDPGTLLAVIPGCEAIERTGPDEYAGRISLRLPGAAGSYRTLVRLVDAVRPERAGMEGSVEGPMGSIRGRAEFELAPAPSAGEAPLPPETVLDYRGDAVIQGPLARLDSRFAERLAESLISQGLRALDHRLIEARTTVASAPGRPSTSAEEPE